MSGRETGAGSDLGAGLVPVRVMPSEVTVEVLPGESVLAAAVRCGFRWTSICGGQASCTVCFMEVQDGIENAGEERPGERERLDFAGRKGPKFRLACQSYPTGPLTVIKRGVKPKAPEQTGS
jgi:ferredoxin, 2Fe-2S